MSIEPVGSRFPRPGIDLLESGWEQIVEEDVLPILSGIRGHAELTAIAVAHGVRGVLRQSFLLGAR